MLCESSVAKLTSTVLSVLSPGLLPFSFRLWWHLNGNHITLSHPLTGSFGSRTNHSLTSVPLPLSIKLSPPPGFILISLLFPEFNCRHERLTRSHQLSWADCSLQIWTRWMIYWTLLTTGHLCFFSTQVPPMLSFVIFRWFMLLSCDECSDFNVTGWNRE